MMAHVAVYSQTMMLHFIMQVNGASIEVLPAI